jgi:hypothetical protein
LLHGIFIKIVQVFFYNRLLEEWHRLHGLIFKYRSYKF